METHSISSTKQKRKKIVLTSIAVGAAGVLGYFGWQFYQKKKGARSSTALYNETDNLLKRSPTDVTTTIPDLPSSITNSTVRFKPRSSSAAITTDTAPSAPSVVARGNNFPLRKGSKGGNVQLLQKALIAKYGKSILPKYGADGSFGAETVAALRKAGLSTTVDESTFNVLTQGAMAASSSIGNDLYQATVNNDFATVLSSLKKMSTTSDYSVANSVFKTNRIDGVRQTIVTGLLHTFTSDDQQQQLKFEFLRIGLQFNGSTWSLSGLGGLPIITVRPATVWTNSRNRLHIPARVVLGNEVSQRLDYTLFENQGQYFLVPTRCVRYV